jgi:hypothetical protein
MVEASKLGSDSWLPALNNLCFDYLRNLQKRPGGRFLKFQDELLGTIDNPGPIVTEYHRSAIEFKVEVFDKNASISHIDHHKIAALYIRSFLIYRPFINDVPDVTKYFEVSIYAKLANEYFSLPFLETIFRAWNNNYSDKLRITNPYKDNFIKLLYRYHSAPQNLDFAALSNIIYLIEKQYFGDHSHG